jgi:hypothetical protein
VSHFRLCPLFRVSRSPSFRGPQCCLRRVSQAHIGLVSMLTVLVALLFLNAARAVPGGLDATWGSGGVTLLDARTVFGQDSVETTLVLDDGTIVVPVTTAVTVGSPRRANVQVINMLKVSADGAPVTAFGEVSVNLAGSYHVARTTAATLVPGGKFLLAGCAQVLGQSGGFMWAAKFDQTTGAQDATFARVGGVGDGFLRIPTTSTRSCASAVYVDSALRLVIGGTSAVDTVLSYFLARFQLDGSPDLSYGVGGTLTARTGPSTVQQLVCAFESSSGGTSAFGSPGSGKVGIILFSATGQVLQNATVLIPFVSTNPDTHFAVALSSCVRLSSRGTLVAARSPDGYVVLVRFLPDSITVDLSFGTAGMFVVGPPPSSGTSFTPTYLAVWPSGNIVVATVTGSVPFVISSTLVLADGRGVSSAWSNVQQSFGDIPTLSRVVLQNNGKAVLLGFSIFSSFQVFVARLEGNAAFTSCAAGPQCICEGALCETQTYWVVPPGSSASVDGRIVVNGNLISAADSVLHYTATPTSTLLVSGTAILDGSLQLSVTTNGSFTVMQTTGAVEGQYASVTAAGSCGQVAATPQYSSNSLSVLVSDTSSSCLSGGAIAGIVVGAVVFAAIVAVAVVGAVFAKRKSRNAFAVVNAKLEAGATLSERAAVEL